MVSLNFKENSFLEFKKIASLIYPKHQRENVSTYYQPVKGLRAKSRIKQSIPLIVYERINT